MNSRTVVPILKKNTRVTFVCITMGHYQMAIQILNELNLAKPVVISQIFCSGLLHDQKDKFCNNTIDSFDDAVFINEFQYASVKNKVWKLRGLINKVAKNFFSFSPDIVITFTDNSYIYQHSFMQLKKRTNTKIVLFHEGYGDYSEAATSIRTLLPYYYIRMLVWPFTFRPVTRSYTGLYNHSFLLEPDIVNRSFLFKKIQIPSSFIKSVFYKDKVLEKEIEKESIFLVLSGKDWINDPKLRKYLILSLRSLNTSQCRIYMKISPNVKRSDYEFLTHNNQVTIIDDQSTTSESFCYHPNFKYIVTDESSAIINAIYGGVKSTIFFLNEDIQNKGLYTYDKNDLLDLLKLKGFIYQVTIDKMLEMVNSNFENENFIVDHKSNEVGEELCKLLHSSND